MASLNELINLDLSENFISDVTSLQNLSNLKKLNIALNEIVDLSVLGDKPVLRELNLMDNRVEEIKLFSRYSFDQIENLNLSYNSLTNIEPMRYLINLETLDLKNNNLADIDVLSKLQQITNLNLGNNSLIKGFSSLKKLKRIQFLDLENTGLRSLSFLKNMHDLEALDISHNPISQDDLEIFAQVDLPLLKTLEVEDMQNLEKDTKIDPRVFFKLESLETLILGDDVSFADQEDICGQDQLPGWLQDYCR